MSSSMTRQHFRAVARFISKIRDPWQRRETCSEAVAELRQFNGSFDRARFEEACGIEEEG